MLERKEIDYHEIKMKLLYEIVNFTGNGKTLKSPELQKRIFGQESPKNDVLIRKLYKELVEEEERKEDVDYIFGSSTDGFFVAKTDEEFNRAYSFLHSKDVAIKTRMKQLEKAYKRKTGKEFQPSFNFG